MSAFRGVCIIWSWHFCYLYFPRALPCHKECKHLKLCHLCGCCCVQGEYCIQLSHSTHSKPSAVHQHLLSWIFGCDSLQEWWVVLICYPRETSATLWSFWAVGLFVCWFKGVFLWRNSIKFCTDLSSFLCLQLYQLHGVQFVKWPSLLFMSLYLAFSATLAYSVFE